MNKLQFNKLDVLEQLKYVNNGLLRGESLRNISGNIGISKSTIRERFKKIGYVFSDEYRRYIKENSESEYKDNTNILDASKTVETNEILEGEYKSNINILQDKEATENEVIEPVEGAEYKSNTNILIGSENTQNKPVIAPEYKSNINILMDNDTKNKLMDIATNYDGLQKVLQLSSGIEEMLNWYNNQKNVIDPVELKVDANRLTGEVKTTTVRLYNDVWKQFGEFMSSYKEYKSMDLISMALLEFMDKYKK